jgi:hypothetical protein
MQKRAVRTAPDRSDSAARSSGPRQLVRSAAAQGSVRGDDILCGWNRAGFDVVDEIREGAKRLVEAVQFAEQDRSLLQRHHVFDDALVIGGVRRAPRERIESYEHVVGWFAGLIVLWSSRAWTTRDEWIGGGLIIPGGLATSPSSP